MSFEKVEKEEDQSETSPKSMFTYAVNMIVSVFAEDEEKARESLNQNGGFVSHREVELKDAVEIYKPKED